MPVGEAEPVPENPPTGDSSGCAVLFEHFSFRYRAQTEATLVDINLRVNRGEKILVLGPSGSGKSTLIHCINGIIPHALKGESSGGLFLMGKNIRDLNIFDIAKTAGTVLQDTDGQFVGLSAAEDIAFAMENDCVANEEMRRRVAKAAGLVDMEAHLGKSPQDLSGGQKQRISIAGVLVDNVELMLFDEPLANLDPAAGKDAIELIDSLHKKSRKTILIVEHRLEDVLYRSVDRIVVMDKGRIVADKKPAEVLASGILRETGIREPLYLSALSYAGIGIEAAMSPEHLDTLRLDYAPLAAWDSRLSAAEACAAAHDAGGGNAVLPPRAGSASALPSSGAEAAVPAYTDPRQGLEVRNLRFSYPGQKTEALKGISFSLAPGECVALVGGNGSGKSTAAKCVCAFVKPDSGTVSLNGRDLAPFSIMERAEKIGYVMQNPNQMISFPMIFDEAALGLRTRGVPESEVKERVYHALSVCGLYPFRNWPVNALSYGQKKRLTIAAILVLRPAFMILDEPTAGQDYRHYSEFMEFLISLNRDLGISLLLITHDMHLMLEYSSRAVVLSEGVCIADAEPFQVLTDDAIIEKASLKLTSLYGLALNAGLPDPRGFVRRYIAFDREKRERAERARERSGI